MFSQLGTGIQGGPHDLVGFDRLSVRGRNTNCVERVLKVLEMVFCNGRLTVEVWIDWLSNVNTFRLCGHETDESCPLLQDSKDSAFLGGKKGTSKAYCWYWNHVQKRVNVPVNWNDLRFR